MKMLYGFDLNSESKKFIKSSQSMGEKVLRRMENNPTL